MKRRVSILKALLLSVPSLGLFLAPNSVWAGSRIYDAQSTCTTTNCSAVTINGTPQRNNNGDSDPFTIQVHSNGNQCMRLDVTNQGNADLEIVLVSPSGQVWRNDDRPENTRPLVKANTDVDGFYTVQINQYNGQQAINSVQGFTLVYGLCNSGNTNCSGETPSLQNPNGASESLSK